MIKTVALSVLLLAALPAPAQDLEFIQAVEDAQRARPSRLSSTARIAPEAEPGTALVVHGRAFAADGRTPLAGVIVFAYHTDRQGVYDRPHRPAHSWRLKGWAKTGDDGRFEFRTIRPAPYPGRETAAHIHLILFTADGARYYASDVLFGDDPLLSAAQREAAGRDPLFSDVRQVRREGAVENVDVNRRIVPGERF
jgi:protocatechuate 3,4-dioxygenase beta subunit